MPVDLVFEENKGYYTIVSVMPHQNTIKGTLLFDGSANPPAATTNGALMAKGNNNGGVANNANTHEKSKVPSTSSVEQGQEKVNAVDDAKIVPYKEDVDQRMLQLSYKEIPKAEERLQRFSSSKVDETGKKK